MNAPAATPSSAAKSFDVERVRADFPILGREMNGHPLVYLDNAATAQKPQVVLDAVDAYYATTNANIHRGVHTLSVDATDAFEAARGKIQRFLGAERPEEIVFVRGSTEAINLVASAWGRANVEAGDEIVISTMEHHSNIVPWQLLCEEKGAHLRVIPISDAGEIDLDAYRDLLGERTKMVAVVHVSNTLGTINPIREMVEIAHGRGVPVLVDGAQATPHMAIDVRELGCDFYTVSGHKMFGPTGIGVLYGRHDRLTAMPPYQGGGEMILSVTFDKTVYNKVPHIFEAGTPDIAGAIGLGATVDYMQSVGLEHIAAWEQELLVYGTEQLSAIPGLRLIGTAREKAAVLSFVLDGVHAHDVGTILDQEGVAVRTGHHCTQPLMERYGVPATARASLAFYNTKAEIDRLAAALRRVIEIFA